MTPTQFQAAIDELDLSQRGVAKLFGADERTARSWASGASSVPAPVAILLRLMAAGKISPDDVHSAMGPRDKRRRH